MITNLLFQLIEKIEEMLNAHFHRKKMIWRFVGCGATKIRKQLQNRQSQNKNKMKKEIILLLQTAWANEID
jgi:hypothetical protein